MLRYLDLAILASNPYSEIPGYDELYQLMLETDSIVDEVMSIHFSIERYLKHEI